MDVKVLIDGEKSKTQNDGSREPELKILYYDISKFNRTTQFLLCCSGVFAFYLIYGYLQVSLNVALNFGLSNKPIIG